MGELTTEYRGYEIRYSENRDIWVCHKLEMEAATLTQLKNKMGRYLAKVAKTAEAIPAFVCDYGSAFRECFIISVASSLNYKKEPEVWTFTEREEMWRGATRIVRDRKKYDASSVIVDSPENRALIEEAKRLRGIERAAKAAADKAAAIIPRVDVSTLRRDDTEDPSDA